MVDPLTLAGIASVVAVVAASLYELSRKTSLRQGTGAVSLALGYTIGVMGALGTPETWLPERVAGSINLLALTLLLVGVYLYQVERGEDSFQGEFRQPRE